MRRRILSVHIISWPLQPESTMSGHLRYVPHVPEEDYDDTDGRRFLATVSNFDESDLL